jgi:aminodeoxychorismate lyase
MIAFINGKFVEETQATVSIFDRGFLYGDGLFEAVRVYNGKFFRWGEHMRRLGSGANFLDIKPPVSDQELRDFASELVTRNNLRDSLLRITLTRGTGIRGYSPKGANHPTLAMTLHPTPQFEPGKPQGWRLIVSSFRLPADNPLARFKNSNKLLQIMARSEADTAGADDALLLNNLGNVAEGSSSNVFWVRNDKIYTPSIPAGILPGVTRDLISELCLRRGIEVEEMESLPEELRNATGVFLSLTSLGIVEVNALGDQLLKRWPGLGELHADYFNLLLAECA